MSDSIITKRALAASLKELLKKKSLQKITIFDIVQNCGLNRQTFYYHFKDKYDLLNWIFSDEIERILSAEESKNDWKTAMLNALKTMQREKAFYSSALNMDRRSVFFDDLFLAVCGLLLHIVDQLSDNAPGELGLEPEDRLFIAEFYAHGLVGMVVQWARDGMKEPPEKIVARLTRFVEDSKLASAARYMKKKE